MRCLLAFTAGFLASSVPSTSAAAQEPEFLPGVARASDVPAPREILGYPLGTRITDAHDLSRYFAALDAASDKVHVERYGTSVEGRPLQLVFVSSAANLARLDELRSTMARIADPRKESVADIEALCASTPAFAQIACSVHGDEISPTDAAMSFAWHLASASGDALVDTILRETVVILDPLQNPDGRERFITRARGARGRWPSPEPLAAERDQPWPAGRFNHELFDMNRDWFALTQVETRARVKAYLRHWPIVYVDVHEMGSNSSYYFAPPAEPLNPHITPSQLDWLSRYGKNNASWFDRFAFDYFTREVFDCFYPGYGDGWPMYQGSIAMTFEEASIRGLIVRRDDELVRTYRDSVRRQAIAFLGTCETTARNKTDALLRFARDRRSATAIDGDDAQREFVLLPGRDPTRAYELARLLAFQGIEVGGTTSDTTNPRVREHGAAGAGSERTIPTGSYVVRLDQPSSRLARVLLARHLEMKSEFLAKQIEKEKRRESTEMYDISAWSLPLMFGVECVETTTFSAGSLTPVDSNTLDEAPIVLAGVGTAPTAKVAYVMSADRATSLRALADLLQAGVRVHCAGKEFRIGERSFPAGSLIVKVDGQPTDLHTRVHALNRAFDLDVLALDSSWVDDGIHFGSNHVAWVKPPRVAIAWDRPTSTTAAGAARWIVEWRASWPTTNVRTERLAGADLSEFDVIVLPEGGGYGDVLGKRGAERLREWVRAGGTLITLGGGATRWLCSEGVDLLAAEPEKRKPTPKPAEKSAEKTNKKPGESDDQDETEAPEPAEQAAKPADSEPEAFDFERAIQPTDEDPAETPGAILAVALDPRDFVAFGAGESIDVLSNDRAIYTPIKLDEGVNVGVFKPRAELLRSGFAFEHKLDQLAQKAYVVRQPLGRGHVIAFAEDPTRRGFCRATERLYLNALFFGPSF
ncbi:MAG: M14 family zinc carboxypeptidase [Planctomycetota bacterium]